MKPTVAQFEAAWVQNIGPSCTTASVLIGLGALANTNYAGLLLEATVEIAGGKYLAPANLDYINGQLDRKIEAFAGRLGLVVKSKTHLEIPGWPLSVPNGEILIAHNIYGQESPGHRGAFGFNPFKPSTWNTGGHSVVVIYVEHGSWEVADSNIQGTQTWDKPGLAMAVTRIRKIK